MTNPSPTIDTTSPAALRGSVAEYRDPDTAEDRRAVIRAEWEAAGIANQFAAMFRAANLDRAAHGLPSLFAD